MSTPEATDATTDPVPTSLRRWFVVHFWADMLFALPLFFAPQAFLGLFGWPGVDPLSARLSASALFGIGIESLIGRNEGVAVYRAMLNLKVIWSAGATVGIAWAILSAPETAPYPPIAWAFFGVFAAFHGLWLRYRLLLR